MFNRRFQFIFSAVTKYGPFTVLLMAKTGKWLLFGSVGFAIFVKESENGTLFRTVGFSVQHPENGNENCTVRTGTYSDRIFIDLNCPKKTS